MFKDGKVFGKINIIDFLIILIIVVALAVFGLRLLFDSHYNEDEDEEALVRITFFGSDVYPALVENMRLGDQVTPYGTELDFGQLVDFSSEPAFYYAYDYNTGKMVEVPYYDKVMVTFVCETVATVDDDGFTVEGSTWCVGQHSYMNVGDTRAYYYVQSYEVLGRAPEPTPTPTATPKPTLDLPVATRTPIPTPDP